MEIEQEKIRGRDAKALLENPLLQEAFEAVNSHLESRILGCDVDNTGQTQRVVLAKQILKGIRREIERIIENGQVAEIQLSELDAKRVSVFRR